MWIPIRHKSLHPGACLLDFVDVNIQQQQHKKKHALVLYLSKCVSNM